MNTLNSQNIAMSELFQNHTKRRIRDNNPSTHIHDCSI